MRIYVKRKIPILCLRGINIKEIIQIDKKQFFTSIDKIFMFIQKLNWKIILLLLDFQCFKIYIIVQAADTSNFTYMLPWHYVTAPPRIYTTKNIL